MQENEKYGIELEAKTSLFKKGMQEAIKYTKAFGQGVKESFVEQTNTIANNWRSALKQTFTGTDYQKELENLRNQRNAIMEQIKNYRGGDNLKELETQYNEIDKKIAELKSSQQDYNEELEETEKISSKTSISLGNLFDRSIAKIKRFTFYLLGARSVFSLFMKYQGIYYQYNEQMRYQSELSQNAIALSLAPAFEFLGNVITYASIGFAKFIELLTGVNVLSKVTTKGIRDYNKSLKESQSLLSGIDEITNLTLPSSTGLADQYKALDDFQKKVKEVEEFFKKNKWIEDLANGLREVWNFIKDTLIPKVKNLVEHLGGVQNALLLLGGIGVIGALGKLAGASGLGLVLAGLVVIYDEIMSIIDGINEWDRVQRSKVKIKDSLKGHQAIVDTIKKEIEELKKLPKNTKEYNDKIKKINQDWDAVNRSIQTGDTEVLNSLEDTKDLAKELNNLTKTDIYTTTVTLSEKMGITKAEQDAKGLFGNLIDWATGNDKSIENTRKNYANLYEEVKKDLDDITTKGDKAFKDRKVDVDYKVDTKEGQKELDKFSNQKFTISGIISAKTDTIKSKLQTILDIYDTGGKQGIFTKIALTSIKNLISKLATGTNYVPYDNFPALLHKGEAVVPAKYNPAIGNSSNDYTNSLLETLVMKIDDLAQRPNVFEIDGQKFANATYDLYDNARSRQNYVEGVVR